MQSAYISGGICIESTKQKIPTSTLLRRLFRAPDLQGFLDTAINPEEVPTLSRYLLDLCKERGEIPEQVIKRSSIDRTYGHQLFNGTRKPSRDKVLQLAFGLKLDLEGTQQLLRIAQKSALYPRIKRDAAILYCINRHMDLLDTQTTLQTLGLTLLGETE